MIIIDSRYAVQNYNETSSIELVPSAVLSVFYIDKVVHLTIDNGCTGNIIRLNVVENLKIDIKPTKVKAKLADDKTFLDVVGEISIELTRGKVSFMFNAIVVRNLGPDALAGTPFQKENDVMTDFVNEQIIVKKKIRFPFTSQHIMNDKPDTFLVRMQKSEVILPGEYIKAAKAFQLGYEELWQISEKSIDYIFADENTKKKLKSKWAEIKRTM